MDKRFMIAAMNRTGHHAVSVWLLHQTSNTNAFNIRTLTQWLFYLETSTGISYLANNPLVQGGSEHEDKRHFHGVMEEYFSVNPTNTLIATHEQHTLKDVAWASGQSPLLYNSRMVVVLRSFKNWAASCVKMAHRDKKNYKDLMNFETYIDHCENYKNHKDIYYILFDNWVDSWEYRKKVAEDLGLEFTDAAIEQLSPFGGGSSFSQMEHIKEAHLMMVNQRYILMKDDPDYRGVVENNPRALEASNEVFN